MERNFDLIHKIQPWPLVEPNFQESDFDLNDVLSKTAGYGFKTLGLLQMMSVVIPVLPIAPMPGLFWSNEKRDLFKQTVIRALKRNDVIVDQSIFEEDWKSFVDFEEELYGFRGSIIEEMVGVEDLKKAVPSMDIERIIKSFMRPKERDEMWERIKDSILIQKHPMLFGETKNLETILATTPKRTIANYLAFHLVGIMSGKEPTDCIKVVTERLPLAALRVYVRNYFDKGNLKDVSDMVNDIKKSYIKLFEESKWLHDETRINAIRKVGAMTHMIGYPEELEEPGSLDKFFESLDLSPSDSYFTAIQKTEKFYMELSIDFVAQLIRIWSYSIVLDANAFYLTMSNLLFVNVALIDDPFFDSTYPKYAKLAGVGAVLGHEMGHGFDPENRKRDENGAMKNWWTPEDSKEYQKRAKCYADEYTNYDDPHYGKNLNGSFAITEIIPDVIGVKSAWKTYKSMDMSGEPGIIGFEDYDLDKLYFQIGALTWCSSRKSKTLAEQQQDNHATPSFRVNGVFSNMKEFGETFNCPVGSPMNPIKKCELF
uniref:Peptidase_M13 domain-containing protein n=2 Tax=Caenorhabditis tropicalis TaxID=1561998 RepID=A0A1I7UWR8_9PELO